MSIEVEVDERRRVSLGKVIGEDVKRLRVETMSDGSVVLTPLISLSQRELETLADPKRVASIKAGIAESAAGDVVRYPAGHWSKVAAELDEELGTDEG